MTPAPNVREAASPEEAAGSVLPAERTRQGAPDKGTATRWSVVVPWLAAGLVIGSVAGALAVAVVEATGHQIDFDIYRMGAAHVRGQDLYDVRLSRALMGGSRGMHFTYPPFAALVFWPFSYASVTVGQVTWSVLNVLVLGALTGVSVRAVRPDWPLRRVWTVAGIALFPVLWLDPDALTLSYGQINFFIVLLVMLDLTGTDLTGTVRWRSHSLPRGVLLGIAAAIKLTPLIFVPFLFLTRQFRAGVTALAAFFVCSLGALAIAPHSSWLYWSTEVFDTKREGNTLYISDQNLHSVLQRISGVSPSLPLLGLLTVLCAAGGLAVAAWAYRAFSPMLGILVCAATGLVISPVSWAHHYVWVVPALAWFALARDRPAGGQWWALGIAALFWAAPIWWISDPQQGYGGPLTLLAGNSFFFAAVALILGAAVRLLLATRTAPATAVAS